MAYEVQNFENGQKLTAEQLNHMEDGIYANSTNMAYEKQNFVNGKKLTAEQLNHMEAGIYANSVNSGSGTVTLPTLTNPGSAGDLAQGKQLIDASGNIVTGNLGTVSNIQVVTANTSVQHSGTSIYVTGKRSTRAILEAGATLRMDVSADKFGNAQRSQVLEGTTFTSSNGLCLTGTMKATDGSSGSSGGLVVKTGAVTGTGEAVAIETGLSSIKYFVVSTKSITAVGLINLIVNADTVSPTQAYCTYCSSKSQYLNTVASGYGSSYFTITGGAITVGSSNTTNPASGVQYDWFAFGTE